MSADYYQDRPTRQTNIEFSVFDGSRIYDWVFKSERFFELDSTLAKHCFFLISLSIASVYLIGLAMDWHFAFIKNRKIVGLVS